MSNDEFLYYRERCIRKWRAIIENMNIQNERCVSYLCMYADYRSHKLNESIINSMDNIAEKITTDLVEHIDKIISQVGRIKLKDKSGYYNIVTNSIEYELENGEFIVSEKLHSSNNRYIIKDIELISMFPSEFQNIISPAISRINKFKRID